MLRNLLKSLKILWTLVNWPGKISNWSGKVRERIGDLKSSVGFSLLFADSKLHYISERVHRFNTLKPPPDVTREEWMTSFTQDSYAAGSEIGYHQRGSHVAELLEKQADLIRYLRDHNVKLSHRMMLLASQRRAQQV